MSGRLAVRRPGSTRGVSWALAAAMLCATGCGGFPEEAEVVLLQTDAQRSGADGAHGPHGVACAEVRVAARLDDSFPATVCWPSDDDGRVDQGGPFPPLVLLQGALVERSRYRWLLVHAASRGFVVAAPGHKGHLPLLEAGNAQLMRRWLEDAGEAEGVLEGALSWTNGAGIMGHSLGGVTATRAWLADERFGALVLLGAYPAQSDPVADRAGDPVLAVSGQRDTYSTPVDVRQGFERFEAPRWLGMVSGLHHFGWCDANRAFELEADGIPARPVPDMRQDAMRLIDAFLDTHLAGDADGYKRLESGLFPGVEVSR